MNDLDMELQTIRQKLQTLKASPPEPITAPWNPSRLTAPSPNLAQVTTAIETLRQRSGQTLSSPVTQTSLQQFDATLNTVDQLAQQQQQAWQRLQSLGYSLVQQTKPGTSPDIDDIARFLAAYPGIQIPTVQRDEEGYLELSYHAVTRQPSGPIEQLRMRSQLFKHPFSSSPTSALDKSPYRNVTVASLIENLHHVWQTTHHKIHRWHHHHRTATKQSRTSHFTWIDGAIWCLGAVIARIILNQIFQFYPTLWTPIAFMLVAGIIFTIYRSILSPRPNSVMGARTLMITIGLLIGGQFT